MGEYITINNKQIKIGTCEDIYYARYEQIKRLQGLGKKEGDTPIYNLLNSRCGYRFRFPFPEEDNIEIGCFDNFNKGLKVELPNRYVIKETQEVDHNQKVTVQLQGKNKSFLIPCPYSVDWNPKIMQSTIEETLDMEIVQQRPFENALWTVCRCLYCGVLFRLPPLQAEYLARHLIEINKPIIAERILSGYAKNLEN